MTIKSEDPRFWDIRTVERRIRKGLMTRKDYEKHLKSLDDVAPKSAPISLADVADDDDDDDLAAPDGE
jgi:hypothetical protein